MGFLASAAGEVGVILVGHPNSGATFLTTTVLVLYMH